jgi:surface protein
MFSRCPLLTSLDISNFDTSKVTSIAYMFQNCTALHTLRLDNCNNATISKIITSSNFPTAAISGVTRTIYCKEENAAGLTAPTNWVFSYVTEEEPSTPLYVPGEFEYDTIITEVRTMVDESHDDLSNMFYDCTNLVSVNTEDWDTSNVTNMSWMFQNCNKLTQLDVSNWITTNVTDMSNMFCGCTSLTQLNLSNFDTSNLSGMSSMFQDCTSLTTLDLSNWDAALIYAPDWEMRDMFLNCTALHTLRLDNCSNDTISKIINSIGFPTGVISGVTRTIYCKEAEATGLTAPTNWQFSYVD